MLQHQRRAPGEPSGGLLATRKQAEEAEYVPVGRGRVVALEPVALVHDHFHSAERIARWHPLLQLLRGVRHLRRRRSLRDEHDEREAGAHEAETARDCGLPGWLLRDDHKVDCQRVVGNPQGKVVR